MNRFVPPIHPIIQSWSYSWLLVLGLFLWSSSSFAQLSVSFDADEPECGGFSIGEITALPDGGTPPYSYLWNTGATTQTISDIPAGNYAVTVTDAANNTVVGAIFLNEPPQLGADFEVSGCTVPGTITAIPVGGVGPYMFMWETGANTQTITFLNPGEYCITIMDSQACGYAGCVIVTDIPPSTVVVTTDALCPDEENGTAEAVVTGGVPPYSYLWNTGATTQIITDLGPGLYSVTVTDANGCTSSGSAIVDEPDAIDIDLDVNNPVCEGDNNGSIFSDVSGGTPPYTYQWSNNPNGPNIFNLGPGMYTVTVTDANGCTAVQAAVLLYESEIEVQAQSTDINCFGQNDGTATALATNGVPPYTYQWSNGQNGAFLNNLPPGIYTVTATDAVGCSDEAIVQILDAPPFDADINATDVSVCDGSNGTATAIGLGGTPPYSYLWNTGATDMMLTGLSAGVYSVTVTDANGCEATAMTLIDEPDGLQVIVNGTDELCVDANDGTAMAIVMGGVGPFTYQWSNGANTATLNNLAPGVYTVTVTDSQQCSDVGQVIIDAASPILINSQVQNIDCFGENTGVIMISVSGGVVPYDIVWSNGTNGTLNNNLPAGTYTVQVTDANDCVAQLTFEITQPPLLEVEIVTQGSTCLPNGVSAKAEVDGGTPPYSYEWSNGATTSIINNIGPGVYTVTVTDANDCEAVETITIVDQPDILVDVVGTDVSCFGLDDGSATAIAMNGVAPYMYTWNTGSNEQTIEDLPPGLYSVTVVDDNGCSGMGSVAISQPDTFKVTVITQNTTCPEVNDGAAQAQPMGGTPPYSYEWGVGPTTQTITGLAPETYLVQVIDANGCVAKATGTVEEGPSLEIMIQTQNVDCFGEATGAAQAIPITGTAPFSYIWNIGETTPTITGLIEGSYTVTVTDALGCTGDEIAIITEPTQLNAAVTSGSASCDGSEDGTAQVVASGGTPPYEYLWSDGQTTAIAINLNPGLYTVTVTDANGCEVVKSEVVEGINDLTVMTQVLEQPCEGSMDGAAQATGSGGTPPYSFMWSNGTSGPVVIGLGAGFYEVTITDANGCFDVGVVQLQALEGPSCNAFVQSEISLPGGSDGVVNVDVTGGQAPYLYEWNNGTTTAQNSGLSEGIYTVTVTDANGCMTTCSVTLGDPPSAKVGDKVWNDEDQDGLQDAGEPGVEDVMVTLTGEDVNGNAINQVTMTDEDGMYLFDPVPPGTYKITFGLPNNFEFTENNIGSNDEIDSDANTTNGMTEFFTLADGDCDLTWDAGIFQFCINVTDPGTIGFDEYLCGPGNDPAEIIELTPPTGGIGQLEYLWMQSTDGGPLGNGTWMQIPNSNTPNYDPGPIFESTYFVRCVRRDGCILFLEPDPILKEVGDDAIAAIDGPNVVCVGEEVTYTAADSGPDAIYSWNFGPNATPQFSNSQSVNVTWSEFGYVEISLTVENDDCTAFAFLPISVTDNPIFCGNNFTINGQQQGEGVMIDWDLDVTPGNYMFQVEYSMDGVAFQRLDDMAYEPTKTHYEFMHETPRVGRNFYRVRLQAENGAYLESNTVEIMINSVNYSLMVYPNPAETVVFVEWLKEVEAHTQLELYSLTGQLLLSKESEAAQGLIELPIGGLAAGTYMLRVQHAGEGAQLYKVVKQ